jgi:hypothetical protein
VRGGFAAIPLIVHPIDNAVHALLNVTLRPALRSYVCGPGQGALADLALCSECNATKTAGKHASPLPSGVLVMRHRGVLARAMVNRCPGSEHVVLGREVDRDL